MRTTYSKTVVILVLICSLVTSYPVASGVSYFGVSLDTTYGGRATGILVHTSLGGLSSDKTFSDTGQLPPVGGILKSDVPLVDNPLVKGDALVSTTNGFDGGASSMTSISEITLLPDTINAITADYALTETLVSSTGEAFGRSQIVDLHVAGQPINITGLPNQIVSVPGILTLVINEQIKSTQNGINSITVNALHLKLLTGEEVIISSSTSKVSLDSVITPVSSQSNSSIYFVDHDVDDDRDRDDDWDDDDDDDRKKRTEKNYAAGSGYISTANNGKGEFGFIAGYFKGKNLDGELKYKDKKAKLELKSKDITSFSGSGNTRTFSGTAKISGKSGEYTFTVTVTDNGKGRNTDTFEIQVSNGYSASGLLKKGNIHVFGKMVTNSPPVANDDSVERTESFAGQSIVDSLDYTRFKQTIQDITSFGPRQQGTQTNAMVLDWLEGQLVSMGYEVDRHDFIFNGEPRQSIYATKIGAIHPNQMYIVSGHMDSVFGTEAADDNGSGMALVLETARAFANPGVKTDTSVRFIFWNNEETNLAGSTAYVQDRLLLQGLENPPGSGLYPEPTWLGHITHDMILYDHGIPPQQNQNPAADIDIEFRGDAAKSAEASSFAKMIQSANAKYSVSYPAEIGPLMCCTDTWPFRDHTAAVSIRENQAFEITLNGSNPHWDKPSDTFSAYSEKDFQFGFDVVRMTAGVTAEVAGTVAPIIINVLANDSDPDGNTLSVTSVSAPSRGTATINSDNTITYTPSQNFVGTDSFTYTISDGNGGTDTATVTITITAINDPPVAADDSAQTLVNVPVTVDVLANDSDMDGDTILLASFDAISQFNGSITRDDNGTPQDQSDDKLVYTPPENAFGTDTFSYIISDGNGGTDAATVTVRVHQPLVQQSFAQQSTAQQPTYHPMTLE